MRGHPIAYSPARIREVEPFEPRAGQAARSIRHDEAELHPRELGRRAAREQFDQADKDSWETR